jgi:uracil-DNA glycosylase
LVFLLWGSFAHKKGKMISREKHLVLQIGHPSPLSANRGFWFGNNHFKIANEYLRVKGRGKVEW